MKKRFMFIFTVLLLCAAVLCNGNKTQAATEVAGGSCGESITWSLDSDGVLTITGEGWMYDWYDYDGEMPPWYEMRMDIKKAVISEGIVHIGYDAFLNCENMTQVQIPSTVESIAAGAFHNTGITGVVIPEGISELEGATFAFCKKLTAVAIPDSVEIIQSNVFLGCTALKEVTIGAGVRTMGTQAFEDCTALEKVHFDAVNLKDMYANNNTFTNTGTAGNGFTLTVGKDVTRIPAYFMCSDYSRDSVNLKKIEFEQGSVCTEIGSSAFHYCNNLTTVTLPAGLKRVCGSAFANCFDLSQLIIPDSVEELGYYAFYGCNSLRQVSIGKGLRLGMPGAFECCDSLTAIWFDSQNPYYSSDGFGVVFNKDKSVLVECPSGYSGVYTVPSTVKKIGDRAFYYRKKLDGVVLPEGVTGIGGNAFSGCAFTGITIPNTVVTIGYCAFSGCEKLTGFTIPDSVQTMGSNVFEMCYELKTISIGKGLKTIEENNLGISTALEAIYVHDDNATFCSVDGVLYTKDMKKILKYPENKTGAITIPEGVHTIAPFCFYDCEGLSAVTLPQTLETIGNNAFAYCRSLTQLQLPDGVSNIDDAAFVGCAGIRNMVIPDGVAVIGGGLFSSCESLETITFGKGVTKIWWSIVTECPNLHTVTFKGNAPQIDGSAFNYAIITAYYPGDDSTWTPEFVSGYYGGWVTWVPVLDKVDKLELEPAAIVCGVGQQPELSKLTVYATANGGIHEVPGHLVTFGTCDTSTTGRKTVTVTYGGKTATLTVLVHEQETITVDRDQWPESQHNYANNSYDTQILRVPGADRIILQFSALTELESNWDYIYVYDSKLNTVATYTGREAAGATLVVQDDSVRIQLRSDSSSTYYGYAFDSITALCIKHVGDPVEDRAPTCEEPGYRDAIDCEICGEIVKTVIPPYGHDFYTAVTPAMPGFSGYTNNICTRCGVSYKDMFTDFTGASGQCGDDVWWELDKNGKLWIYGHGPMYDYSRVPTRNDQQTPWSIYAAGIQKAVIGQGITHIGSAAFAGCDSLQQVSFEGAAPTIAADAFADIDVVATYPADEESWTDEVLQDFAGSITWGSDEGTVALVGDRIYSSFGDAFAAYKGGQYLKLLADTQVNISLHSDLYIDLNGFDLSGTIRLNGYKVYGMDATTNIYTCDDIGYFTCVDEKGNAVVPETQFKSNITGSVKRYMAIMDENGYSFHRFYLAVTHKTLRPDTAGVGYKAVFYGDTMVIANLQGFGFHMQLGENDPKLVTKSAIVSGNTVTLRIDNYDVAVYGETELYASAVLILKDGTVIESTKCTMTLRSLLETISADAYRFSSGQLQAIAGFIKKYPIIATWEVDNLI